MTKFERILLRLPPVAFISRKSKEIYLPGFQKLPLYDVVIFFFQQINRVGLNERAAAISFNLIMALPAALIFLFSIIPYLPESDSFETQILSFFKDVSPNSSTYMFIRGILKDLLKKQVGIFSFGFLLLVFYASNAMMGIIRTFDKSIQENKVYFLHQRWRAVRLTVFLILLVIASATLL
ncbi:MAG: YihY/virulence factor BrkB family protein, partial [Chitinophagaceae bacterium]